MPFWNEPELFNGDWESIPLTTGDWKTPRLRPDPEISPIDAIELRNCIHPNFTPLAGEYNLESLVLDSTVDLGTHPGETIEYSVFVVSPSGSLIRVGYGHDCSHFVAHIFRPGRAEVIVAPVTSITASLRIEITRSLPPPNPRYDLTLRVGSVIVDAADDMDLGEWWPAEIIYGHRVSDGPGCGPGQIRVWGGGFTSVSISITPCNA